MILTLYFFITWNNILVVLYMHMINPLYFFKLHDFVLLHDSLRIGDLVVIWKNIQPKMDMKKKRKREIERF